MSIREYICPIDEMSVNSNNASLCFEIHTVNAESASLILRSIANEQSLAEYGISVLYDLTQSFVEEVIIGNALLFTTKRCENGCVSVSTKAYMNSYFDRCNQKHDQTRAEVLYQARSLLEIARQARASRNAIIKKCFMPEKAEGAINRIIKKCNFSDDGRSVIGGYIDSSFFLKQASYTPYFIKDKFNASDLFFGLLIEALSSFDINILVDALRSDIVKSVESLSTGAVFLPYEDDRISLLERSGRPYKIINLERFLDTSILKCHKNHLRFLTKCELELENKARSSLMLAKDKEPAVCSCEAEEAKNLSRLLIEKAMAYLASHRA